MSGDVSESSAEAARAAWPEQRADGSGRSRMAGSAFLYVAACLVICVGLVWFGVAIGRA